MVVMIEFSLRKSSLSRTLLCTQAQELCSAEKRREIRAKLNKEMRNQEARLRLRKIQKEKRNDAKFSRGVEVRSPSQKVDVRVGNTAKLVFFVIVISTETICHYNASFPQLAENSLLFLITP